MKAWQFFFHRSFFFVFFHLASALSCSKWLGKLMRIRCCFLNEKDRGQGCGISDCGVQCFGHRERRQRPKLTPTVKTASFSKESAIWTIFDPRITQTWLKMMRESCVCLRSKEIWVFGSFRLFFKISQVFQIKKKWLIKNFEAIVRKFLLFWNKRFQRSLFHKIGPSLTKSLYN